MISHWQNMILKALNFGSMKVFLEDFDGRKAAKAAFLRRYPQVIIADRGLMGDEAKDRFIKIYLGILQDATLESIDPKARLAASYLLEATWAALPDSPFIHQIPGFGVLCDLCSEVTPEDLMTEEEMEQEIDEICSAPSTES
jgi:hypothetical protein